MQGTNLNDPHGDGKGRILLTSFDHGTNPPIMAQLSPDSSSEISTRHDQKLQHENSSKHGIFVALAVSVSLPSSTLRCRYPSDLTDTSSDLKLQTPASLSQVRNVHPLCGPSLHHRLDSPTHGALI